VWSEADMGRRSLLIFCCCYKVNNTIIIFMKKKSIKIIMAPLRLIIVL
jgi:hypothetical protein